MEVRGIIPALCTPTDEKEQVNEASLRKLLDYTIANGVHGVFILSSTGEFFSMSKAEKRRAIEITVDHVAGRVPVMVGACGIGTRESVEMVEMAQDTGADLLSVLTPMMIIPNDQEIYDHYKAIAASTDLPVSLYNNPDRTNVNISAKVVERLADVKNIVAVKDSSGDMGLMIQYIMRTRDKGFTVLSGRDVLIFANLVHGGTGAVAAIANVIPAHTVEIYDKFMAGDYQGALKAQLKVVPYRMSFGLATWPAVTKDALNLMGFNVGEPLKPVIGCKQENLEVLKEILQDLKIL